MSRFDNLGDVFLDDDGKPLAGGRLTFYESGTTTVKTTYSDAALSIANTSPVILDASGRPPPIFFDGAARGVLATSSGVQVDEADPIGGASSSGGSAGVGVWNSAVTYALNDLVKASNSKYYLSLQPSNNNNDPITPSPLWWMEARLIGAYNANANYSRSDIAESNDALYISLADSNQGNPITDRGNWRPLSTSLWTSSTVRNSGFAAAKGVRSVVNTTGGPITATLPLSPAAGDRVGFLDYAGTWATNNVTLNRNGSRIMGLLEDMALNRDSASVDFEYIDAARGWTLV